MGNNTSTPVMLVQALEVAFRKAGRFQDEDFRTYLLPAAIVGHVPTSPLAESSHTLRKLVKQISEGCTGLWVERIANAYRLDPVELKALWRLADEDREAAILKKVRSQADKAIALARIRKTLECDYLSAEREYVEQFVELVPREEFDALRVAFVSEWLKTNSTNGASHMLDAEQLAAIAQTNGTILVTARAGSGKTTTLVTRAIFLMRHCNVAASEILMLAFNRSAATSMKRALLHAQMPPKDERNASTEARHDRTALDDAGIERIARSLGIALPIVMTFHALAYGIVNPDQNLLVDDSAAGNLGLSRVIQELIDDHLRHPEWQSHLRATMLLHFRHDWEAIEAGGYNKAREELIAHRSSLPRESLRGDFVKSYGEKVIADFLLEHGVPYRYERNHRWDGFNYRPDFTIFRKTGRNPEGVIIEYFGMQGDADYDALSERKRSYWKSKPGWDFLEFGPRDIVGEGVEAFALRLSDALAEFGIPCRKLSEDEVWEIVKRRAIDRFTGAIGSFVSRCRKQLIDPHELGCRLLQHSPISEAEEKFLIVAQRIHEAYGNALRMADSEDFDGLIVRAIAGLSSGHALVRRGGNAICDIEAIRFMCVDEFQDFSELFYQLLIAVQKRTKARHLCCVGDDWQAINGFAGSDLRYFEEFGTYFEESRRLNIATNYRSCRSVVAAGNIVMSDRGTPARAKASAFLGSVSIGNLEEFNASPVEQARHAGDDITPAVLRIINHSLSAGRTVAILCRRNSIPWYVNWPEDHQSSMKGLQGFLDHLRSFLATDRRERVTISTAHSFKGLERDDVVILDAVSRSFPLIHPDWIFSRVLGVKIEDLVEEDRRLFYVATTRARNSLFMITSSHFESSFLRGLDGVCAEFDWRNFSPVGGIAGKILLRVTSVPGFRIANDQGGFDQPTYAIRESLKLAGFRFTQAGSVPAWERIVDLEGFDFDRVIGQEWIKESSGIEIRALDSSGAALHRWVSSDAAR